jgi:hypothetical protein
MKAWHTKEWKEQREKILENQNYCSLCYSEFTKENPPVIHHWNKNPNKNYVNLESAKRFFIVIVCKKCHFLLEKYEAFRCPCCKSNIVIFPRMVCEKCLDDGNSYPPHILYQMGLKRLEVYTGALNNLERKENNNPEYLKNINKKVEEAKELVENYKKDFEEYLNYNEKKHDKAEERKAMEELENLLNLNPDDGLKKFIENHKKEVYEAKTKCWKCGKEISVYNWYPHNDAFKDNPPPIKIPTIKKKATSIVGTPYYLNECPYCKASQGDWFLYYEPEGAFFERCKICEMIERTLEK